MTASFSVDVASFGPAASTHDDVATQLAEAQALLRRSLGGAPWGDDEPGREFGTPHRRSEDRVLAAVDDLMDVIRSVAVGLRSTAATYVDAETATTVP